MNSTINDRPVRLSRVLLLSCLAQAILLFTFYQVDRLRMGHLQTSPEQVRELDEQARTRLQALKDRKELERKSMRVPEEDADRLLREADEQKAKTLREKVREVEQIREELWQVAQDRLDDLQARTAEDMSEHLYLQLRLLATQLVTQAEVQDAEIAVEATPEALAAARQFAEQVRQDRTELATPEGLDQLHQNHEATRQAQREVIEQLDYSQAAYSTDDERIRRENRVEYLVNLARDRISGVLGDATAFDAQSMNTLPEEQLPEALGSQAMDSPDPSALSTAELHQQANAAYQEIRDLFQVARAADLAMNQFAGLQDMMDRVHPPPAPSRFSNKPADPSGWTISDIQDQRSRLQQAGRDIDEVWQHAQAMALTGRSQASPPGPTGMDPAGAPGGGARRAALLANAAQGNFGHYVDVSPFMRSPSGEQGASATLAGGLDVTHTTRRTGFDQQSDTPTRPPAPPRLQESEIVKEALPGRIFDRRSPRTGWLYIDTWYVIGPWENDWKTSFDQPLPPETLINLDAEYVGKDDQPVRWRFHQSDNIRIKPPEETEGATYYGYTEVYFEEATDLLLAVASDDAAKVWINDVVVWQDRGFSPWRIDEGLRRVHFRQGFNSILVRIENGPVTCTFSVLLCPDQDASES